ncbi:MAG TPA: TIGR01777 family oxidoreductase [Ilumatobacter sp.]|nr:TIGR01777 family oxidoreductase [Ilumatobacter sp.]
MRVGITGASGMIGMALRDRLNRAGHEVVGFTRGSAAEGEIAYDPAAGTIDRGSVATLDAIVNLAGAGIGDHRWTDEYRATLVNSRVDTTSLIARTMAEVADDGGPSTLISGSAIGYYGDRDSDSLTEVSRSGDDFLAQLCVQWEEATAPAVDAGVRVAHVRTGIVLTPEGGALKKMLPLFKLGLGGRFGTGKQWMSWISLTDEVRAIEFLLTNEVAGPVNLTAPNPVTNRDFAAALAKALRRPAAVPVPSFGPKLLLGSDLAESLLFFSQRVAPCVLERAGFSFEHAEIRTALPAVLARLAAHPRTS